MKSSVCFQYALDLCDRNGTWMEEVQAWSALDLENWFDDQVPECASSCDASVGLHSSTGSRTSNPKFLSLRWPVNYGSLGGWRYIQCSPSHFHKKQGDSSGDGQRRLIRKRINKNEQMQAHMHNEGMQSTDVPKTTGYTSGKSWTRIWFFFFFNSTSLNAYIMMVQPAVGPMKYPNASKA